MSPARLPVSRPILFLSCGARQIAKLLNAEKSAGASQCSTKMVIKGPLLTSFGQIRCLFFPFSFGIGVSHALNKADHRPDRILERNEVGWEWIDRPGNEGAVRKAYGVQRLWLLAPVSSFNDRLFFDIRGGG